MIVIKIASSWSLALSKVDRSRITICTIAVTITSSWSLALIKVDCKRIYLNLLSFSLQMMTLGT